MGKDRTEGFEVMKASDTTIMRTLEKAIQFGSWVLIENVGKVYYHISYIIIYHHILSIIYLRIWTLLWNPFYKNSLKRKAVITSSQ